MSGKHREVNHEGGITCIYTPGYVHSFTINRYVRIYRYLSVISNDHESFWLNRHQLLCKYTVKHASSVSIGKFQDRQIMKFKHHLYLDVIIAISMLLYLLLIYLFFLGGGDFCSNVYYFDIYLFWRKEWVNVQSYPFTIILFSV